MKGTHCGYLLVVVSAIAATTLCSASQDECTEISDDSGLSCDFAKDFCGWSNNIHDDFNWTISGGGENNHASAKWNQKGIALFESPWLCPTGTNVISLEFKYFMGQPEDHCHLSVLVQTPSGNTTILTLENHIGDEFNPRGPLNISCTESRFKIIFAGKKLIPEKCGTYLLGFAVGIDIDDIVLQNLDSNPVPKVVHSCKSSQTTGSPAMLSSPVTTKDGHEGVPSEHSSDQNSVTSPTTESEVPTNRNSEHTTASNTGAEINLQDEEEKESFGSGAVAGTVIASAIIAVAAVVAVICIRKRNRDTRPETSQKIATNDRGTVPRVSNVTYFPEGNPHQVMFSGHAADGINLEGNAGTFNTEDSGAPYSIASDRVAVKFGRGADDYEIAVTGSEGAGGLYQNIAPEIIAHGKRSDALDVHANLGMGQGGLSDEYNALSFDSSGIAPFSGGTNLYDSAAAGDTYNTLSRGNRGAAHPKTITDEYDHVQK